MKLIIKIALTAAIALLCTINNTQAQQISAKGKYVNPVQGAAHRFSAVFGEMRTDHFHSGVDFKTDGVEGKRIVAAASGYISRIGISTSGFGICLYVTHPSLGTTTAYAHLSKFRDDIAKYAEAERHKQRRNNITLYLNASQFPVKQGDLIGFSGNSGSSGGPHLHYEVREAASQKPLNPVTIGAVRVDDNIAPTVRSLYYIETQTIGGIRYEAAPVEIELEKRPSGNYAPVGDKHVMVGRSGYFVIATTDRKNYVANTFGLYTLVGEDNGHIFYSYKQDGFLFSDTRYVNGMSYYPMQRGTSAEYYRMMRQPGVPSKMFDKVINDGMILTTYAGEQRQIEITAGDDRGNKTAVKFTIEAKRNNQCFKVSKSETQGRKGYYDKDNYFTDGVLEVMIPTGALYSSVHYFTTISDEEPKVISGSKNYSAIYNVMDYDTPLHKAMEVTLTAYVPDNERNKVVMGYVNRKGSSSALKATYKDGKVTAYSRAMGGFYVATDTQAPTITFNFKSGANIKNSSSITINIKDNFSGIATKEVHIDGKWYPIDRVGSLDKVFFNAKADGKRHTIKVRAVDNCGNVKVVEHKYIR